MTFCSDGEQRIRVRDPTGQTTHLVESPFCSGAAQD